MSKWRQRSQNAETGKTLAQIIHGTARGKKKSFSVSCSLIFLWSHLKSRRWACRTIRGMLYITFHWGHKGNSCIDPWGNVLGNIQRDVWRSKGVGDRSGHDGRASGVIHVFLLTVSNPSVAAHSSKSTENSWNAHSLWWGSVLWNQSSSLFVNVTHTASSFSKILERVWWWWGCLQFVDECTVIQRFFQVMS